MVGKPVGSLPYTLSPTNSTSPSCRPDVIDTVAFVRYMSVTTSTSITVMLALTIVAAPFSTYDNVVFSMPPSTGASFTASTVTERVTALLVTSPSFTVNDTVRIEVEGSSELLLNCTK